MGTIEDYISSIPLAVDDAGLTDFEDKVQETTTLPQMPDNTTLALTDDTVTLDTTAGPAVSLFDQFIHQIQISGTYVTQEQALMLLG